MNFSFIIVSHGSAKQLLACLDSFRNVRIPGRYEILITNDCPEETGFIRKIQQQKSFSLIELSENRGFGAASNRAAEKAQGKILVFMNPDARWLSGNFSCVFKSFGKDGTSIGAIGFQLLLEQNRTESWGFGKDFSLIRILRNHCRFLPWIFSHRTKFPMQVDWVSGAAMAVWRESFFARGGFDESFFLYYEDADLCARFRRAGRKILFMPDIHVLHIGGASISDHRTRKQAYFHSQDRYFARYRPVWERVWLRRIRRMFRL